MLSQFVLEAIEVRKTIEAIHEDSDNVMDQLDTKVTTPEDDDLGPFQITAQEWIYAFSKSSPISDVLSSCKFTPKKRQVSTLSLLESQDCFLRSAFPNAVYSNTYIHFIFFFKNLT